MNESTLPKRVLEIEFAFYALECLGCRAQRGDRLLQIKLGFLEGAAHHCLLARVAQILDCLPSVAASPVVIGQVSEVVLECAAVDELERFGKLEMEPLAPSRG